MGKGKYSNDEYALNASNSIADSYSILFFKAKCNTNIYSL